jgi:hypothetical protein
MTVQNGFIFLFSGATGKNTEYRNGAGLLITKHGNNSLMEWKPVSERILTARFKTHIYITRKLSVKCLSRNNKLVRRVRSHQHKNNSYRDGGNILQKF